MRLPTKGVENIRRHDSLDDDVNRPIGIGDVPGAFPIPTRRNVVPDLGDWVVDSRIGSVKIAGLE